MDLHVVANGFVSMLVRRYAGPFRLLRRRLAKTQWWDRQALEDLQLQLLRKLVRHCYETVPYYQRLMRERGITPESIASLDDIRRFPILTKQEVLKAGETIVSRKYPRWRLRRTSTSGTTGSPLTLYRNLFSIGHEHAFVRRQWDWAGIGFSDRLAYLKGRVVAEGEERDQRLYVYDPVMKELHLSTYHLAPEVVPKYVDILKQYKVKGIIGYPSSIYPLAQMCLDRKISLHLDSVLLTSETLAPSHQDAISAAFGCKIFDFYGAAERVCYIFMCEHGRYHIQPEYGLTELIPVNSEGHCKIVATGFWTDAMPLLRYDTGDLAIPSEASCPCGRAFPVVDRILGRQGDAVTTPSGRQLGAAIMTHLVYVICGAGHFLESQVIQDAPDHITLEYVPGDGCAPAFLAGFAERLREHLPADLQCSLRRVKAVQRTPGGKIRPIVSRIAAAGVRAASPGGADLSRETVVKPGRAPIAIQGIPGKGAREGQGKTSAEDIAYDAAGT
jgi:phenylacetate-CoA ligase